MLSAHPDSTSSVQGTARTMAQLPAFGWVDAAVLGAEVLHNWAFPVAQQRPASVGL